MLTSLLKMSVGAAVRANGLKRRGGGDDGCCCRHWRRGKRTPDGNVRARYVFATECIMPLEIRFSAIIYSTAAVDDPDAHTQTDAERCGRRSPFVSLSLSNRVCCGHVANGRKRERTNKTKWRERHSATNWSDCWRRIWR